MARENARLKAGSSTVVHTSSALPENGEFLAALSMTSAGHRVCNILDFSAAREKQVLRYAQEDKP